MFDGITVRLDCHGLDKAAYDACTTSPYPDDSINAVFDVGLAICMYRNGYASALTDSLKIVQYSYCGYLLYHLILLIRIETIFLHTPENENSCRNALEDTLCNDSNTAYAADVRG